MSCLCGVCRGIPEHKLPKKYENKIKEAKAKCVCVYHIHSEKMRVSSKLICVSLPISSSLLPSHMTRTQVIGKYRAFHQVGLDYGLMGSLKFLKWTFQSPQRQVSNKVCTPYKTSLVLFFSGIVPGNPCCQKSQYQDMATICHCHAEGSTWISL